MKRIRKGRGGEGRGGEGGRWGRGRGFKLLYQSSKALNYVT